MFIEAGRVLSKKNEEKLRKATEALAEILALLDEDDGSDEAKEARRELQEAANLGNWLEARIHLAFTEVADYMFGEGRLTREERIGLSSAIGAALDAFNASISENLPHIYERTPWADAPVESGEVQEAALSDEFVPLLEQAVRGDGTILAKLIEPGWGSSGYYPREVLKRDGPKIFLAGTKQFWNHPTATEEAERPEGDLNALAAELISDARYLDGPAGEGLYADAKVFAPYQEAVNELAPHIGLSIRATGRAVQGEAEGRKGPIITALTAAKSADFVVLAGAGGQIIQMFEAARAKAALIPNSKEVEVNEKEFKEAIGRVEAENLKLRENLIARDARDLVRLALGKSSLPAVSQERLLESLSAPPPTKEGALDGVALAERVKAGVEAEAAYLSKVAGYGGGRVEGMGHAEPTEPQTQEALTKRLSESFVTLGLSEKGAAIAANSGW